MTVDTAATSPFAEWRAVYRVEAIAAAPPEHAGWVACDLTLRPLDRRGRVNGRTKALTRLTVGGPPEAVNLTGLAVGRRAEFHYSAGPAPTNRSVIRPVPA